MSRYLELPKGFSPRIKHLASTWTASATKPEDKATAILQHLRHDYTYDLSSPSGAAADPIYDFLFVSKRGHCEYFSTAMAVMLRSVGIPSRNVTGFLGGSYNHFGDYYSVRQADAHSWVEAYVYGKGWMRYDPTPAGAELPMVPRHGVLASMRDLIEAMQSSWDRRVVRYDLKQQMTLVGYLKTKTRQATRVMANATRVLTDGPPTARRPWHVIILLVVGIGLLALSIRAVLRRLSRGSPQKPQMDRQQTTAASIYERLDKAMRRAGIPRDQSVPPTLHAETLLKSGHALAEQIDAVTRVYLEVRFGRRQLTGKQWRQLERTVDQVKRFRPPKTSG